MPEEKRHTIDINFQVLDPNMEKTVGKSLFFGRVQSAHLLIYEEILKKHFDAAESELLQLQKAGRFR